MTMRNGRKWINMLKRNRFISLLLSCAIAAMALGGAALAADRAVATTLRLERVEGSVAIESRTGKSVSISDGMKLFSGYSLFTELKSYAYISLDDTKAVKLDAASEAVVKQTKKKLEVDLKSGNLFFNVTAPVAEDEDLSIRTSTMVTGIRGTAGFVRVISEKISEVYILEGTVTLVSTDPLSGESRTVTVSAGQRATSYIHTDAENGESVEIIIDNFVEEDVPGFVAQEIKKDEELQQAITDETNLSVPKIIDEADDRLAADESAMQEQQKQIDQLQSELENEKLVDPLFKDETIGAGDIIPFVITYTFDGPLTEAELQAALLDAAGTPVTLGPNATVTILGALTIPVGETLINYGQIVNNGFIDNLSNTTFIIETGATVTGTGALENGDGYLTDEGRMIIRGSVTNNINNHYGTLSFEGGSLNGILSNNDTVNIGAGSTLTAPAGDTVIYGNTGSTVNMTGGTITGNGATGGAIQMDGSFTMSGGTVSNFEGSAVIMNAGGFTMTGGSVSISGATANLNCIKTTSNAAVNLNGGSLSAPGYDHTCLRMDEYFTGTVTVAGCTITGNGGIYQEAGSLVMTSGTVTGGDLGALYSTGGTGTLSGGTLLSSTDGSSTLTVTDAAYSIAGTTITPLTKSDDAISMFSSSGTPQITHTSGTVNGKVMITDGKYSLADAAAAIAGTSDIGSVVTVTGGTLELISGSITDTESPSYLFDISSNGIVSGSGAGDILGSDGSSDSVVSLTCSVDDGKNYELYFGNSYSAIVGSFGSTPVIIDVLKGIGVAAEVDDLANGVGTIMINEGQDVTIVLNSGAVITFFDGQSGYGRLLNNGTLTLEGTGKIIGVVTNNDEDAVMNISAEGNGISISSFTNRGTVNLYGKVTTALFNNYAAVNLKNGATHDLDYLKGNLHLRSGTYTIESGATLTTDGIQGQSTVTIYSGGTTEAKMEIYGSFFLKKSGAVSAQTNGCITVYEGGTFSQEVGTTINNKAAFVDAGGMISFYN